MLMYFNFVVALWRINNLFLFYYYYYFIVVQLVIMLWFSESLALRFLKCRADDSEIRLCFSKKKVEGRRKLISVVCFCIVE